MNRLDLKTFCVEGPSNTSTSEGFTCSPDSSDGKPAASSTEVMIHKHGPGVRYRPSKLSSCDTLHPYEWGRDSWAFKVNLEESDSIRTS
jgi:hypothetical protein